MVYSAEEGAFFVNRIGQSGGERSGDFGQNKKR
jgi:hypothetical protein